MPAVDSVEFALVDPTSSRRVGRLRLSVLGQRSVVPPPLLDLRSEAPSPLEPVQLIEGVEYRYDVDAPGTVRIGPEDLLSPDDDSGRTGRFRPREHTGRLPIVVVVDGRPLEEIAVEVRSKKLGYLDDYRYMLEDIAHVASELVLRRFAATEQRLVPDTSTEARSLHGRFRFVRAMLTGARLQGALALVLSRPHIEWREYDEPVLPGQPLRASSRFARLITKPGPRQPWPGRETRTLPVRIERVRHEETTDSVPNRFVRFVLEDWRDLVARLREALVAEREASTSGTPAAIPRGLRELDEVEAIIGAHLRHPVLSETRRLDQFPIGNQVLERRPGYREIHEAFLLSQVSARIEWNEGDDIFGAGQRDVATLYEYWVFLRLAAVVARLAGKALDVESLVRPTRDGVDFALRRGRRLAVRGVVTRLGRRMAVELVFDRSYERADGGTWTRSMRPDCSLEVRLLSPAGAWTAPVRLHFDAKYRVERAVDALGVETTNALPTDIAKMHAYRDAILGAAGAYAIYPGSTVELLRKHDELLPSLGAFPLRPGPDRQARGEDAIVRFIDEVLWHLAHQASAHERVRYWEGVGHAERGIAGPSRAVSWWSKPPADVRALFVRGDDERLAWATERRCWPVPVGPSGEIELGLDEFGVQEVVLCDAGGRVRTVHRIDGPLRLVLRDALVAMGHPGVDRYAYLVLPLDDEPLHLPSWLDGIDVGAIFTSGRDAEVVRWIDILRSST